MGPGVISVWPVSFGASFPMSRLHRSLGVSFSRVGKLLLQCLFVLFLLGVLVVLFGAVEGEEFSPQTFERRQYSFYCVPFTRWQISPTFRTSVASSLESKLRTDRLVNTTTRGPATWDLMRVGGSLGRESAAAGLLADFLDAGRLGYTWEEWTDKNPARAKVFWPAVQEAAELGTYELVPDLFDFASSHADDATFASELRQHLSRAYESLADDYRRTGQEERAKRIRDAGLRHASTP